MVRSHEIKGKIGSEERKGVGTTESGVPGRNSVVDTRDPSTKIRRRNTDRTNEIGRSGANRSQTGRIQVGEEGARHKEIIRAVLSKEIGQTKEGGRHVEQTQRETEKDEEIRRLGGKGQRAASRPKQEG